MSAEYNEKQRRTGTLTQTAASPGCAASPGVLARGMVIPKLPAIAGASTQTHAPGRPRILLKLDVE
jgi:hypothetical protein